MDRNVVTISELESKSYYKNTKLNNPYVPTPPEDWIPDAPKVELGEPPFESIDNLGIGQNIQLVMNLKEERRKEMEDNIKATSYQQEPLQFLLNRMEKEVFQGETFIIKDGIQPSQI